jgi:hypothetical protein
MCGFGILRKRQEIKHMNIVTHPQTSKPTWGVPAMGVAVHRVLGCSAVLEEAFYRCLNGSANATDMQLLLDFQPDWAQSDQENTR